MKIKVINTGSNRLPAYETKGAAAVDLLADIEQSPAIIEPGQRKLILTGLYVQIPEGYELQIRPRSGLARKKGITVVNSPGTIDSDYRGEIGVILINYSSETFRVYHGDRIAQAVLSKVEQIEWEQVDELEITERGDGGFGHTGR